ncbi:MAG: glycosyltransferase family 2 protein [Flavobacteriales bacterium]
MRVSITIPCRNEVQHIEACVRSMMIQTYPGQLITVYVVDGMSDDGTRQVIRKLTAEFSNVKLLDNTKCVTPVALNLGLKADSAEVKIIFGAHAVMSKNYVEECVRCLNENPEAGCVGGLIFNTYENKTSEAIGLAMSSPFGVGGAHFRTGAAEGWVDTVAFGAYRQEVFSSIGYFDEELVRNQDDEFNYRLLRYSGYKIFLSKHITSEYVVRASYKKLEMQYYQYGYWKVYVNKKHKVVTTLRQMVPFAFVSFLLLASLASIFSRWGRYALVAGWLLYLLSATVFAIRKSVALAPRIIWSFFLLHFSYGFGYLLGIVHFLAMGRKVARDEKLSR